jgi:hypothetical protein
MIDYDTDLLVRHYKAMLEALNDIKDVINTDHCTYEKGATVEDYGDLLLKIENLAGNVSTIDLFNPYNRPGEARKLIEAMPFTEYTVAKR